MPGNAARFSAACRFGVNQYVADLQPQPPAAAADGRAYIGRLSADAGKVAGDVLKISGFVGRNPAPNVHAAPKRRTRRDKVDFAASAKCHSVLLPREISNGFIAPED